ncbi:ubiquitin-conjugating enzyme E2-binding protein [Rhexocercosporidium sp. MPI-PUGE-AT-0058]|nr:ubiquitin-conjugating enzyme E2-binding protein [Rhexocercosporidium sp. MPI-PUGE-AT-0058]
MSPTKPLIYAELLSNIRQISVIVALDVPCGPSTKAELSADGQQFILQHDGDITLLNLPGQAVTSFQLQKPILGNKELSWRIPVAGQATRASLEDAQSNAAPWSAKELSEDAELACRDCGAVIVKRGAIKEWRDLPSENWAEMMEFWHCHKPDLPAEEANSSSGQADHVHPEQAATSKGYGATSKFTARAGIGFVDLTTFLLASTDCTNLKIAESTDQVPALVLCNNCNRNIGRDDSASCGRRLLKWCVTLSSSSLFSTTTEPCTKVSYPSTFFICSQALALTQAQCVSRLILSSELSRCSSTPSTYGVLPESLHATPDTASYPGQMPRSHFSTWSTSTTALLIWFISPCIRYACTRSSTSLLASHLAAKVFWKVITSSEAKALLDGESAEEIVLPDGAVVEIGGNLRDSALCLPPSARKFREWDVGLMERYQPDR